MTLTATPLLTGHYVTLYPATGLYPHAGLYPGTALEQLDASTVSVRTAEHLFPATGLYPNSGLYPSDANVSILSVGTLTATPEA